MTDENAPLLAEVRAVPRTNNSVDSDRCSPITANQESKSQSPVPAKDNQDEENNEIRIRRPLHYHSIHGDIDNIGDDSTAASISRYKYYNKLAPHRDSILMMPDHVVPSSFFITVLLPIHGKQGSLITIFSLWNTMMGTSLLTMPWAIKEAGFFNGIALLILMAVIMWYTGYRILHSTNGLETDGKSLEFSDVCHRYLGRGAEVIAVVSSLLSLIGGMIVYWILMSNFLYNVVSFIYRNSHNTSSLDWTNVTALREADTFPTPQIHIHDTNFDKIWDLQKTVPFFLILVLAPLINFKSPTFFTRFNTLGTLSVIYLICFVAVNASRWGFHLDIMAPENSEAYIPEFRSTFPALTGVSALAYFVHNCLLAIVRTQKHPENSTRDLTIAYILVAATYIYMGVMFYAIFPLAKDCIEDNLLNNMPDTNILSFVARVGLFFQMTCVFPLLVFVFRLQFMHSVFGSVWPSLRHILILNVVLIAMCLVFAIFLPHIGHIIGFIGAFCGFSYAIAMPCLVYLVSSYQNGSLTWPKLIIHTILILIGLANFVGQFLIIGKS
ncbi:hypothetical protein ScPMuIL_001707 [Solemya velum]